MDSKQAYTHTHNHEDSNKKSDSEENCLEFSCVKRQWEKGKNARKKYKWMLLCVSRCYHARSFSDIKFKIYDSKDVHRNEKKNREEWADCMHKTVQNRVQQQEGKKTKIKQERSTKLKFGFLLYVAHTRKKNRKLKWSLDRNEFA